MSRSGSSWDNVLRKLAVSASYDPETGRLVWLHRDDCSFDEKIGKPRSAMAKAFNKQFAGTPAFAARTSHGYLMGSFLGHKVYAHQVSWFFAHGEWPSDQIDHINGDRSDNRLSNLRIVSAQGNLRNARMWKHNKSGENGVYASARGKWCAAVMIDQKTRHLGTYSSKDEAIAARKAANIVLGFTSRHGCLP